MSSPSNSNTRDDSNSQSQSQSQPAVPSSPLFFASSSNPPSEANGGGSQTKSRRDISSPLHYTSSIGHHTSDIGNGSSRIRSDRLTSEVDRITRRHQRSDLHDATSSPMRRRMFADSVSDNNGNRLPMSSSSQLGTDPLESSEPVRVIWGTNVSIQDCSNSFRDFLMLFKYKYRKIMDEKEVEEKDNELYYINYLNNMKDLGLLNLNLDAKNLLAYPPTKKLYYQLINYPQEVIPIMDQTVKDCMIQIVNDNPDSQVNIDDVETNIYTIRPYNINLAEKGMRELNPNDIDKLVSVKGLVIRSTAIIPDMKVAFFKCNACGHTVAVEIDRGVISEPTKCPREVCGQTNSMMLIHNRSSFADKQVIKLQETPDLVPDGQTPHSINLCVYDELVDSCRAGDRIEVCGIFRSVPVRANSRQRAIKSLYKTYLDVVHVKKINKKRLGADVSTLEHEVSEKEQEVEQVRKITAAEITEIKEIAQRDDLYEVLARSLAPSIYEMDDVKKGILLQMFGGTNKTFKKGGRYRGDINVLLCGDPSTSKSQLLQYVHKISPRGVYTSGKGSSAVGLTAYITRDVDTKQLVLESGALVLSDGGVCCIDEFDKMSDSTRSVLHEVMEQQTISISKAGITTTLNARTSILAAANPLYGRYNTRLSPHENINLPAALLSRFDIMYLILDQPSRENDELLAHHVTYVHMHNKQPEMEFEPLNSATIRAFINRARSYRPTVPKEVGDYVVQSYINMRKESHRNEGSIKKFSHITPRTLLGILRLAQASARLRFDDKVSFEDVDESLRLIQVSKSSLYGDEDQIREDESPTSKIYQIIRNIALEDTSNNTVSIKEVQERVLAKGFTIQQFDDCIVEYDQIGIWQTVDGGESLMFIDSMEM